MDGIHQIAVDTSLYLQDQQDHVEALHKKNENTLAMMTGMTEFTDADALDRVVNSVARLESSFIAVAAHEPVHIHGAGLFSAISPECPRV